MCNLFSEHVIILMYSMISHQGKFQPFYKYAKNFNSDDFDYDALDNSDYIFMRWKVSRLYCCHIASLSCSYLVSFKF